jgi:dTMP kinase
MSVMTGPWVQRLGGKFIVFDGPDGCGKTTQFRRFVEMIREEGLDVCDLREPGGTTIGERIREILLDRDHHMMDVRCELMLYMASRAQLVQERIRPALAGGALVVADRFISSTLAYQGFAGGIDDKRILDVGQLAVGDCWPNLVVIFDVDQETAARRLNPLLDRMESKSAEFHQRVRRGYLHQARDDPQHHLVIDARESEDVVFKRLCDNLRQRFQ